MPILYAWLIIGVVVGLNRLMAELHYAFKGLNAFLAGGPRLMIQDGKIIEKSLQLENLRKEELLSLLREYEVANTGEVQYAFLEPSGSLGLIRRNRDECTEDESTYPAHHRE